MRGLASVVSVVVLVLVTACGAGDDGADPAEESATVSPTPTADADVDAGADLPLLAPADMVGLLLTPEEIGFASGQVEDQSGTFTVDSEPFCLPVGSSAPPVARVKHFVSSDSTENLNQTIQLLRPGAAEALLIETADAQEACPAWDAPVSGQTWAFTAESLGLAPLGDETIDVRKRFTTHTGDTGAQDFVAVRRGDYLIQIWSTASDADHDPARAETVIETLTERLDTALGL